MYRLYVYNLSKQKMMPHITFFLVFKFYPPIRELRVGALNLADQDYRLNPLYLFNELPCERTLATSLRLNF